jgi:hypothetical protein
VEARIGDVPVGTRILTLFTRRQGWVLAHNGPEVGVKFDDGRDKSVHAGVLVEVVRQPRETVN